MSDKKGRFLHQEWIQKYLDGIDLQKRNISMKNHANAWYDLVIENEFFFDHFNDDTIEFRIKPKTITIGTRTINAPISVKPEIGQEYYMPSLSNSCKYSFETWSDSNYDKEVFNRNLCHLTADDAVKMTDALLSLMGCK